MATHLAIVGAGCCIVRKTPATVVLETIPKNWLEQLKTPTMQQFICEVHCLACSSSPQVFLRDG